MKKFKPRCVFVANADEGDTFGTPVLDVLPSKETTSGTAVVNSNIGATYDSGIWDPDDALEEEDLDCKQPDEYDQTSYIDDEARVFHERVQGL
ncbi:hypothetical protein PVAP13_5NG425140 [Panicum virgatum]|uniref:Uncharacterized protein n=1 Tax=Panicum virgatum TaxID=38727 RepID=A0A8T0RW87_PANVG|nr:hypothetical protein PVAP13_5NG425140 [Panicum virgatum]